MQGGRDLFLQQAKSDATSKRAILADLRLKLKIFAWFESQWRIRAGDTPFDEISIDSRMKSCAVDSSRIARGFEPGQEMVNFPRANLRKAGQRDPPFLNMS